MQMSFWEATVKLPARKMTQNQIILRGVKGTLPSQLPWSFWATSTCQKLTGGFTHVVQPEDAEKLDDNFMEKVLRDSRCAH